MAGTFARNGLVISLVAALSVAAFIFGFAVFHDRQILFGVHTGPQNCSYEDLRRAWRTADDNGFEWVSIWDHFYPALTDPTGTCFEAVSIMTALACETRRVRVGPCRRTLRWNATAARVKALSSASSRADSPSGKHHGIRSVRPAMRLRSSRSTSRLAARISGQRVTVP